MLTKTDFLLFSEQQQIWQNLPISDRITVVQNFVTTLQRDPAWSTHMKTLDAGLHSEATIRSLLQTQIQQAERLFNTPALMPGITGESNELYCVGRGIVLVVATESASMAGLLLAIQGVLLAGNSVVLWPDSRWYTLQSSLMTHWQTVSSNPSLLISLSAEQQTDVVLHEPLIEGVIYLGTENGAIALNRQLAMRSACIITPVVETDSMNLPLLSREDYLLRLVTERTRTINLTAIGGNASLMEQGVSRY